MVKNQIIRVFIPALIFYAFLSCSKPETEEFVYDSSKRIVLKDIAYGKAPRQKMNLFLPAGRDESTQVIILIHGGGWQTGDKSDFDLFGSMFADSGIAAITINYRYASIPDKVGYTEILNDIEKAIVCLTDSSENYTINAGSICLLGHSAGGHLSLLYAYRNNQDVVVNKVVSLAGPTDLTDPQLLNITGVNDLVNALTGNDPGKRADASPVTHANNITTRMYHGKTDAVVPFQQSEKLFEMISSLNSANRCKLIENCGHDFNSFEIWNIFVETVALIKNKH
jgi:acetyl esterase/lipase